MKPIPFGTLGTRPTDDEWVDREALRKKIEQDVQEFLDAGGEIEQCPDLDPGDPNRSRKVYLNGREFNA